MKTSITFEIIGEPASKANSRRNVMIAGVSRSIKSSKALKYVKAFEEQCPTHLFDGYVGVRIDVWYASWRPDLDESLILDCMQGKLYKNDRQVVEKFVRRGIDRGNPRSRITVYAVASCPLESNQGSVCGKPDVSRGRRKLVREGG